MEELKNLILREKNVPFIDLRAMHSKEEWAEMMEDGSHPTNDGHEEIFRKVKKRLVEEELLEL